MEKLLQAMNFLIFQETLKMATLYALQFLPKFPPSPQLIRQKFLVPENVLIIKFKEDEDAVIQANNTPYGLSASIYTQNISKAHKLAAQVQSATVWINAWLKRDLRVPFGGLKQSGIGREGGDHSIDFYTEQKTICVNLE